MMRIGFDAKRAFHNKTGLGNYSRSIIDFISKLYPENQYFLFTPGIKNSVWNTSQHNMNVIEPNSRLEKMFSSFWRTFLISEKLKSLNLDIYHGLSHELPASVKELKTACLVTIHDLIFLRYPEFYKFIDRQIYLKKVKYSCAVSRKIIATSIQTKSDIIEYLKIPEDKIEVVYQGCNPLFYKKANSETKAKTIQKYGLPDTYILSVGTIEERKNILLILKSLVAGKIDIPLVVVGRKTVYFNQLNEFIIKYKLENQVIFLQDVLVEELAVMYQMSQMFIYPSLFEGFGIPILEALNSGVPVITSIGGCFKETGGAYSVYINPNNVEELVDAIKKVLNNQDFRNRMVEEGKIHAENFREEKCISKLMNIYSSLIN
jgi:glycosyltransferase involved in cell wall biosynthesis